FKEVGKLFGSNIKEFQNKLLLLNNDEIDKINHNGVIKMVINNEEYEVNKDMLDIKISSKEGFNVGMDNNNYIILNTT
ncbi:MAG: DUF5915 domain-containing protein, partial [Bacilli bacterium]